MVIIDDINGRINPGGGIAKIFSELRYRFDRDAVCYKWLQDGVAHGRSPRLLERYRSCQLDGGQVSREAVFHSTYYRLPRQKVPAITTVHDFTYERVLGGPKRWVHSIQKSHAISGSDMVICVSENTKQDLLYFNPKVDPDRCRVIYNGVSDDFTPLASIEFRGKVLFVGERSRYKNFLNAVLGLSLHPHLELVCVGGGPFKKEEIRLMNRYIPKRYDHLGYVSVADLNKAYNEAFCLLYPSHYEGFGIPIIEAQKVGCPVVACASSSIPEIAGEAAILMESGAPDEIAHALRSLENSDLRCSLRSAGFENAKRFSWEQNYRDTMAVYMNFLS